MITIYRNARRTIKNVPDFCGLSSDEKPMDAKNGSTFLEIDTGNTFKFDEEGKNWYEQPQSGGGSGGTTDYTQLENKPSINGITLEGNQTTEELDIIPVVDLGELSGEPPIQITLNEEQIQTMQKDNCIVTALYSGANLCLRKFGGSDTQFTFSGIAFSNSIYFLVNVSNSQGIFDIFNIAEIPSPTGPDDAGKTPVVNEDGTGWLLGAALQIDDSAISAANPWSSKQIVDTLAPAFSASGPVVTCQPVAGYPLEITSQITAVQSGTGDPSFENVRPISGWTEATVTHNDSPITLQFGQTVYGGTLDWQSGVLTITYAMVELGTLSWSRYVERDNVYGFSCIIGDAAVLSYNLAKSDKLRYFSSVASGVEGFGNGEKSSRLYVCIDKSRLPDFTVESFKAFLAENPIMFMYLLAEPTTIQLTPQEILALSGINNIYADTGDVTVSGRADPNAVINNLAQRIAALESAATNL